MATRLSATLGLALILFSLFGHGCASPAGLDPVRQPTSLPDEEAELPDAVILSDDGSVFRVFLYGELLHWKAQPGTVAVIDPANNRHEFVVSGFKKEFAPCVVVPDPNGGSAALTTYCISFGTGFCEDHWCLIGVVDGKPRLWPMGLWEYHVSFQDQERSFTLFPPAGRRGMFSFQFTVADHPLRQEFTGRLELKAKPDGSPYLEPLEIADAKACLALLKCGDLAVSEWAEIVGFESISEWAADCLEAVCGNEIQAYRKVRDKADRATLRRAIRRIEYALEKHYQAKEDALFGRAPN